MGAGGLYAIVDPALTRGRDPLDVAEAILRGGCRRLQLRDKRRADREVLKLAHALRGLTRDAGARFVMNDRPDLARLAGADGLHLGQGDLSVAEARSIFDGEVGVSTHDDAQLEAALASDADLIAVGPVFDTTSKQNPDATVGLDGLRERCARVDRPVVAIGGIDLERAAVVRAAGASWVAVISAVCGADDPEAASRAFCRALPSPETP